MPSQTFTVVGLGEVLWDLLPAGKQLGGAPANFAYIANLLGDRGIVASRIGIDDLGTEAMAKLEELFLPTCFVQAGSSYPTGTVVVEVDFRGQPKFEISQRVAWDFLVWTTEWRELAESADAVCFGSLAQRAPQSRETIRTFLQSVSSEAVRVFDVNLRQSFYSAKIIKESLELADIVKMNSEELAAVGPLLGMPSEPPLIAARSLQSEYELELLCVTRGSEGSFLVDETDFHEHPGVRVAVADAVGAGDAFTAALVHQYLRGASLREMNEAANHAGSWVASQQGGTPVPGPIQLEELRRAGPRA